MEAGKILANILGLEETILSRLEDKKLGEIFYSKLGTMGEDKYTLLEVCLLGLGNLICDEINLKLMVHSK